MMSKKAGKAAGADDTRLRQQAIGVRLRHMFDEIVNEPVPDEFIDILRRADSRAADSRDRMASDRETSDRGDA